MSINNEFIKETVRAHYIMQLGIYISELTDITGMRLSYTHRFNSIWYNSAYDVQIEADQVDELINTVETYMTSRNRLPCIYVSPATKPSNLGKLLEMRGYKKTEVEAWMFYDFGQYSKFYAQPPQIKIVAAQTEIDFDIFANIYRQTLPSPEVDLQIQACVDGFHYKSPMVDVDYFVATYEGEPAGMLSSLTIGQYNCLYSGATIKKFQGRGIMRSLMHHAASLAIQKGVKYLFLQTLAKTRAETVFEKFGFLTLYARECYTPIKS